MSLRGDAVNLIVMKGLYYVSLRISEVATLCCFSPLSKNMAHLDC